MEVTDVKVFPVHEERLKAYVTITFDGCFVVRDLKIIHGNSGLFVAMPSKKRRDGSYKDTAHPLNNQTRQMIESCVLDEFEDEIRRAGMDPAEIPARRPFSQDGPVDDRRSVRREDSRPSPAELAAMDAEASAPDVSSDDGDELPSGFKSKV